MSFIPAVIGAALISTAATVATTALTSKSAPAVTIAAPVTVRQNTAVSDALQARRGSSANMRTGIGGAEASTGTKTKLGA